MLQLFDEVNVLSLSTSLISVVTCDSLLQRHILNEYTVTSWLCDGVFGGMGYPGASRGLGHTGVSSQTEVTGRKHRDGLKEIMVRIFYDCKNILSCHNF